MRGYESTSDYAEAQWLLEEIQQLHRGGLPRSEIALLYRSNAQSRVLESALFNAGLPYRVYGGLRFFERAEIKHALAYLRLLENVSDDTSFLRVVNFPTRGIGARAIEQLQDAAKASGRSLAPVSYTHLDVYKRQAVPALILAGAGSGKTRVLTTRIAWLLQTGQASPGGVLGVTFTNKAAKEMLTRLSAMLPVAVRGMWIGTFHGLCNRFLRAHWKLAGLAQGFQILDSSDQLSAVKRVIKGLNLDEERFVPKQVTWFIAARKEEGERPRGVEVRDEQTRKLVEIYQAYEDQCQREGVVDFAELMLRTYELLRDNDPLREHYQRRFGHVLVDEFQDTNKLQYAWLKMRCV